MEGCGANATAFVEGSWRRVEDASESGAQQKRKEKKRKESGGEIRHRMCRCGAGIRVVIVGKQLVGQILQEIKTQKCTKGNLFL